jgi:hypothetical protein
VARTSVPWWGMAIRVEVESIKETGSDASCKGKKPEPAISARTTAERNSELLSLAGGHELYAVAPTKCKARRRVVKDKKAPAGYAGVEVDCLPTLHPGSNF